MNKRAVFLIIVLTAAILSNSLVYGAYCIKSSDDYATEVVLNKPDVEYNLNYLATAKNVILREGKYTFLSHSSDKILVIISEIDEKLTGGRAGLSIKLQSPTKTKQEIAHTLDLISKSTKGKTGSSMLW